MDDKAHTYATSEESSRRHRDRNVLGVDAFTFLQRRRLRWLLVVLGAALLVTVVVVISSDTDVHPHPATSLAVDGDEVVATWQGQECERIDPDRTVVRELGAQVQVALWVVREPAGDACGETTSKTVRLALPPNTEATELVDIACSASDPRHEHC